jgi:Tfp pilus assembly protein PilO
MNKNKSTLIFYLSILTALLTVGVFIFFFRIIKNKNEHTSAVLTVLENKIIKKENINTLEKKVAELEATRQAIEGYFVNSNNIDSFINYLEKLGTSARTQLEVENVEISTVEKNTVLVKLSVKGTFTDVMQTVTLIENIPYQIHFTSVYLSKNTQSVTSKVGDKEKVTTTSVWQADVSFKILSSS